jgi:Immunity protein 8
MTMRAKLKRLHSPDVDDLAGFTPDDPGRAGLFIQMMVGPADSDGEESFDVVVCTAPWLQDRYAQDGMVVLRHHVLVHTFEYRDVHDGLRRLVEKCIGDTWEEIANQVGQIGKWEFEGA